MYVHVQMYGVHDLHVFCTCIYMYSDNLIPRLAMTCVQRQLSTLSPAICVKTQISLRISYLKVNYVQNNTLYASTAIHRQRT